MAFAAVMLGSVCMCAQTGLNINKIFSDSYRNIKGAAETWLVSDELRDFDLSIYHSISFKNQAELGYAIEKLVATDGANAVSKEVRYKSGHLYYGFYVLAPQKRGWHRYIIYLNDHLNGGNRILLLYMEGKANAGQVKKMLK